MNYGRGGRDTARRRCGGGRRRVVVRIAKYHRNHDPLLPSPPLSFPPLPSSILLLNPLLNPGRAVHHKPLRPLRRPSIRVKMLQPYGTTIRLGISLTESLHLTSASTTGLARCYSFHDFFSLWNGGGGGRSKKKNNSIILQLICSKNIHTLYSEI